MPATNGTRSTRSTRSRSTSTISSSNFDNSHHSDKSGSHSGRSVDDATSQVKPYLTSNNSSIHSNDSLKTLTASDNSSQTSIALSDTSQPDDTSSLDAIDLDVEKKSIFSKIRNIIAKKVTIKKLLFLYIPATVAIIASLALGAALPIAMIGGLAAIYFIGLMIAKYMTTPPPESPEDIEKKAEFKKLEDRYNQAEQSLIDANVIKQEEAIFFESTKKNDEVEKDKKDIQDPSELSTWQKIKHKLKIAAPFILGASLIALGVAATVATGGVFAIVAVSMASLIGVLCIGKGITEVLDYRDEKQAFLDSQNKKQVDDTLKAIDSTTGESDIPEDPRGSIQDQILTQPKDLDPEEWGLNSLLPAVEDIETKNNQDDLPPNLFSATNSSLPSFNLSPINSHLGPTYPDPDAFPKKTDWEASARSTPDIDNSGFLNTTPQLDSTTDTRNKVQSTQADNQKQDTYNLQRFLDAHDGKDETPYRQAIQELKQGKKTSHWIWYVFPQFKGLGSSLKNEKYSIQSKEECLAYMQNAHLGMRLVNSTEEVLNHKTKSCLDIFGDDTDVKKFHSCMRLFNETLQNHINEGNSPPTWLADKTDIFLQGLNKS